MSVPLLPLDASVELRARDDEEALCPGLLGPDPVIRDRQDVESSLTVMAYEQLGRHLSVRVRRMGMEGAAKPFPLALERARHRANLSQVNR
jgi:hypothetical protein